MGNRKKTAMSAVASEPAVPEVPVVRRSKRLRGADPPPELPVEPVATTSSENVQVDSSMEETSAQEENSSALTETEIVPPPPSNITSTSPASFSPSKKIATTATKKVTVSQILQKSISLFKPSFSPPKIIAREIHRQTLEQFIKTFLNLEPPTSSNTNPNSVQFNPAVAAIYLSGSPGTGKTALVDETLQSLSLDTDPFQKICFSKINCMSFKDPKEIYRLLYASFTNDTESNATSVELEELINSDANVTYVAVLDEIDSLVTKHKEILYQLFEWTKKPPTDDRYRFVVVGIANSLNLMETELPRLKINDCEPYLLHFQPYQVNEIAEILKDRLRSLNYYISESTAVANHSTNRAGVSLIPVPKSSSSTNESLLFLPSAVDICARKMAGSGDIRKALDVARRAVEILEQEIRMNQDTSDAISSTSSKTEEVENDLERAAKRSKLEFLAKEIVKKKKIFRLSDVVDSVISESIPKVTVQHVMKACGSLESGKSGVAKVKELSMQCKFVLGVLILMGRGGIGKKINAVQEETKKDEFTGEDEIVKEAKKYEMTVGSLHETYLKVCLQPNSKVTAVTQSEFYDVINILENEGLVEFCAIASSTSTGSSSVVTSKSKIPTAKKKLGANGKQGGMKKGVVQDKRNVKIVANLGMDEMVLGCRESIVLTELLQRGI
ncbi:AAA ATPase [Nowakowskiella sp. JEL0407]|nr:AAA ATPase [Nowakowskiella sp. JEL0407]